MFSTMSIDDLPKNIKAYEKAVVLACKSLPEKIIPKLVIKEYKIYYRIYFYEEITNFYIDRYGKFIFMEDEIIQSVSPAQLIEQFNQYSKTYIDNEF